MIKVENLTKRYGDFVAVDRASFTVERGEVVGLLGPNGAGKTTTMRVLTCFFPPTSGRVEIAGFDVFAEPLEVRKRLGYLPENVPLYRDMTVESYLRFVSTVKSGTYRELEARLSKVMDECGLAPRRHRIIKTLSRGYQQRVGLAQALVNDPEILILDEPTIGLDPRQIVEIRNLIKNLAGQRTIILSSHILPEVSQICQRVIIINNGRIAGHGTPQTLSSSVHDPHVIQLAAEGETGALKKLICAVPGVQTAECTASGPVVRCRIVHDGSDPRRKIAEAVIKGGLGLLELTPETLSLEDVFVKLITEEQPQASGTEGESAS